MVPREHLDCFAGRVGLFHNQPADRLLDAADLVLTIGFDPVEYDPALWNRGQVTEADPSSTACRPTSRRRLSARPRAAGRHRRHARGAHRCVEEPRARPAQDGVAGRDRRRVARRLAAEAARHAGTPVHPLRLVHALQEAARRRHDALLRHGLVPHLDGAPSHRAPAAADHDQQRPADARGGAAVGDRGVPREAGQQGDLGVGRRRLPVLRSRARDRGAAEVQLRASRVDRRQLQHGGHPAGRGLRPRAAVHFGPVDVVKFAESMGARGLYVEEPTRWRRCSAKAMDGQARQWSACRVSVNRSPRRRRTRSP